MKRLRLLTIGLACLPLGGVAMAADLVPPNWRGAPGHNTTTQAWEFLTQASGPLPPPTWVAPHVSNSGYVYYPELDGNPYGQPELFHIPGPGAGWHAKQPTGVNYDPAGIEGDGWVNLSGELVVYLPNNPVRNPIKEMWIQLTWEPQAPGNEPILQLRDPAGALTTIPLVATELWSGDPVNTWREVNHYVYHMDIRPNPDYEILSIRGGISVDELVIDTQCVPEPASFGMALILAAGTMLRRRK